MSDLAKRITTRLLKSAYPELSDKELQHLPVMNLWERWIDDEIENSKHYKTTDDSDKTPFSDWR